MVHTYSKMHNVLKLAIVWKFEYKKVYYAKK